MALHFRRIVSLLLREFLKNHHTKPTNEIYAENMINFMVELVTHHGCMTQLSKNILSIICNDNLIITIDRNAKNTVAMWLRRRKPLI
ncbi:Hypothetical protein CINCED_3A017510, partial [Cinara cedri]